jgi:excisionase family DNA binding protein
MSEEQRKLLTVKEASDLLGVTPLTLRNWDKSGKLEASRHPFNNYRVYQRAAIDKLLTEIATNKEKRPTVSSRKKTKKLEVTHLP